MFYMKRVLKGENRITHHINKGFLTFYLVYCVTVDEDTLQEAFTNWCRSTGLGGELSSHCGRKAFSSRLAKSKHTSQEDIIATLLRHNENDTIYHYVEESTGTMRVLASMYENL